LKQFAPTEKQAVNIIQTAWLTYIAYINTLIKYTPTIPWSVRRHINLATLNIRGGFDRFTKHSYITHKCLEKDMDFMAIIDSNHKNLHQIKWDTSHWPNTDTDTSPWTEMMGGVLSYSPIIDGIDAKFELNSVPTNGG
jgi:hypothetical protein